MKEEEEDEKEKGEGKEKFQPAKKEGETGGWEVAFFFFCRRRRGARGMCDKSGHQATAEIMLGRNSMLSIHRTREYNTVAFKKRVGHSYPARERGRGGKRQ